MAAFSKTAGVLVARTGAVLLALSALAWFVVSAQRDANGTSQSTAPPVAPAAGESASYVFVPDAPAASQPVYQFSSKSAVIDPPPIRDLLTVESRPVYQFSSKFVVIDRPPLRDVLATESRSVYQPSSKAGPVRAPFPSVQK